jgi:hypothetical protein
MNLSQQSVNDVKSRSSKKYSRVFTTLYTNAPDVKRVLQRRMVVLLTFRLKTCSLFTLFTSYGDKVLLTLLFSRTQPLIRYELSDRLRLAAAPWIYCPVTCYDSHGLTR